MFDRHGSLDVLLDSDWLNLVLSQHRSGIDAYTEEKGLEITGASFNALLLGIMIYHGYIKPTTEELFGGTKVWGHMMEYVLALLPSKATIPEVMVRVIYILQGYLLEVHVAEEEVKAHHSRKVQHERKPIDLSNLWYGSLNFLKYWVSEYSEYFSDLQLREFEQAVLDMCKRLHAPERIKNLTFQDQEIDRASHQNIALIDMTAHMCMKLRHQVGSIANARSWHSMGFCPPAAVDHLSARTDVAIALPFSHVAPSLPQLTGKWVGVDKEKNRTTFRAALKSTNNSKVSIFGGAGALANFDSSDDDDNSKKDPNDATQNDKLRLEARVPKGFDLKGRDKVAFWSLDSLELARQWTLADHKLFQNIPPHNLLNCSWADARHSLAAPNIRRFIDRFNCVSVWASSSILTGKTAENRASIYEYIVKLAHHFRNLHNFHSLMALLTGLQRGCISRLTDTLTLVTPTTKADMTRLLADMDGSKNFGAYRRIIDKFLGKGGAVGALIPHLGSHLAEITSVDEGNSDYISNAPHLLNVTKLKLSARTVLQLADMQKFRYNLTPIRIISCAIDKALQPFVHLTSLQVADCERSLYDLSKEREPMKLPPRPPAIHTSQMSHGNDSGSGSDDGSGSGSSSGSGSGSSSGSGSGSDSGDENN